MLTTCGCVHVLVYVYANASGCVGAHFLFEWRAVAMLARTSFLGGALCGYVGALSLLVGMLCGCVGALSLLVGALCGCVGALCGYVGALSLLVGAHCGYAGALSFWVARTVAIQKYAPYFQEYIIRIFTSYSSIASRSFSISAAAAVSPFFAFFIIELTSAYEGNGSFADNRRRILHLLCNRQTYSYIIV